MYFRNCDRRFPFLWESTNQPAARWNGRGEGPVQYLADTPDGAWAEFVRHEEIVDEVDLTGVSRALWAVQLDEPHLRTPDLPEAVTSGDPDTYEVCQQEARRLRTEGAAALVAPSAALLPGTAGGYRVELGFQPGPRRTGQVYVLFGTRPHANGWQIVDAGCPPTELLSKVRHFTKENHQS